MNLDQERVTNCDECIEWKPRPGQMSLGWCEVRKENTYKHETVNCIFFEELKVEVQDE